MLYIDRKPPVSAFDSFHALASGQTEVWIRSVDLTADRVYAFANLPSTTSNAETMAQVAQGKGKLERIDRALFKATLPGLKKGANQITIVTFEPTGNSNLQPVTAELP